VRAANTGLDQEQDVTKGKYFSSALKTAVQQHKVSMHRLNDMVLRIMRPLFRIGVFDHPPAPEPQAYHRDVDTAQQKALARRAGTGGAVLLKNAHRILPLHGSGKRIAVIGWPAGAAGAQTFYQGGGSSKVPLEGNNPNVVAPLQGITTRATRAGDVVTYSDGSTTAAAAAVAKAADVAVVVVGDGESEGIDRSSLAANDQTCTLFGCTPGPGANQNKLVAAVANANPNTIVVVQAGGPIAMPWLRHVRGVLDTWYPGEQDGNIVASLLFGDANPAGKLPVTFPRSMAQSPIRSKRQWPGVANAKGIPQSHYSEGLLVGYRWYDAKRLRPLFPFGYGLSYTRFRFSGLRVHTGNGGSLIARFVVTNVGSRAGAEVAQLYVGDPRSAHEPPKQLKGYAHVQLRPGQRRTVRLRLGNRAFAHWAPRASRWQVARGCYRLRIGGSSRNLPLHAVVGRGGATCR
jgi:beta-glucosidase